MRAATQTLMTTIRAQLKVYGAARWQQAILATATISVVVVQLDAVVPLPGSPLRHLFALLSGICPQRPSHSYTLGGVQLPLEARMAGMFLGFGGATTELLTCGRSGARRWPHGGVLAALSVGFSLMAFDGSNALLFDLGLPHAYSPDVRLRLATGVLAGLAMGFILVPTLAQSISQAIGKAAPGWRDIGIALLGSAALALLVVSSWGWLLLPLSLIIASGVVLSVALINHLVLSELDLFGKRSSAQRTWFVAALAVSLALGELLVLALLRHVYQ